MTQVDLVIKKGIINYFSIFPTRAHILLHIFLSYGNGFYWSQNGEIIDLNDNTDLFETTNSDGFYVHVNRLEENKQEYLYGNDDDYTKETDAAISLGKSIALFYENNIDVIACTMSTIFFRPFLPELTYDSVNNFQTGYGLLGQAVEIKKENPDFAFSEEWKSAIKDIVECAKHIFFLNGAKYHQDIFDINDVSHWNNTSDYKKYQFLETAYRIMFPEEIKNEKKASALAHSAIEEMSEEKK